MSWCGLNVVLLYPPVTALSIIGSAGASNSPKRAAFDMMWHCLGNSSAFLGHTNISHDKNIFQIVTDDNWSMAHQENVCEMDFVDEWILSLGEWIVRWIIYM